nr:MAG TPA: hypothetical protein [Bacteriophage sp.]
MTSAGNGIVISGSGGQLPSCPRFRCPFRCCNTGAGFSLFLLHSLHPLFGLRFPPGLDAKISPAGRDRPHKRREVVG